MPPVSTGYLHPTCRDGVVVERQRRPNPLPQRGPSGVADTNINAVNPSPTMSRLVTPVLNPPERGAVSLLVFNGLPSSWVFASALYLICRRLTRADAAADGREEGGGEAAGGCWRCYRFADVARASGNSINGRKHPVRGGEYLLRTVMKRGWGIMY